jgi:triosephosphate isomerase
MKIAAVLSLWTLLSAVKVSSFIAHNVHQTSSASTPLFSRKPFITGNWKLNPTTRQEAVDLATGIANSVTSHSPCDVALFVPFPFIEAVTEAVDGKLIVGAEVRTSPDYHCDCLFVIVSL